MGALLGGGHLKGAAGAGRSLLKEEHDVFALEHGGVDACPAFALKVVPQVQEIADLQWAEVHEGEEALAFHIDCHDDSPYL